MSTVSDVAHQTADNQRRRLIGVIALMFAFALVVCALTFKFPETPVGEQPPIANALSGVTYLVLGTIVLWNRPGHVMARVMLGLGLLSLVGALTQVLIVNSDLGFVEGLTWVAGAEFIGYGLCSALLIHLFPTGRPPTPAWRWPVRMAWVGAGGLIMGLALGLDASTDTWVLIGAIVFGVSYAVGLLTAIPSLGYRFWRSSGVERAQVKWFLLAATIAVVGFFSVSGVGSALAVVLPPLAITIALTRYRLYDIDRIISRTASYTIVTGLLLLTYAVIVTTATRLLPDLNTLAVAAATLAAAALARPLLRRVQHLVDRRFNRARYDAERTVNAFVGRLVTEVSPAVVAGDLHQVVTTTLEPARVTVWTRERP